MRTRIISLVFALAFAVSAAAADRCTEVFFADSIAAPVRDSVSVRTGVNSVKGSEPETGRRMGESFLFMPKGTVSVGLQGSYFNISGDNSTLMLLLQDLDASGRYLGVSPYFGYCYRANRVVGLKLKYATATGGIAKVDLQIPGLDMDLGINDLGAQSTSFSAEVFHRSYWGLDARSRFGLFIDTALQYRSVVTSLSAGQTPSGRDVGTEPEPADPEYDGTNGREYTRTMGGSIVLRAGLEVFVMNNVSTMVSIGIGGLSYTNSRNFSGGELTGTKNSSNAQFSPDILGISMGLAFHF